MELCQVAGVSRAGYYRFQPRVQASEADMDLRSAIQQIALEWPSYGYRRVHRELMRRGWKVNHKRGYGGCGWIICCVYENENLF